MPFDLQPTLKGELLELGPLREEDFHELFVVAAVLRALTPHIGSLPWARQTARRIPATPKKSAGTVQAR